MSNLLELFGVQYVRIFMQSFSYTPSGVCSKMINFSIEDGKIYDIKFFGGCPGNLLAIGKLLQGADVNYVVSMLKGNPCGNRGTSCTDQLAIAVEQAMSGALSQTAATNA